MNLNMHVVPSEGLKMSPNNIIYKEIYTMGIKEFSIRNRKWGISILWNLDSW